MAEYAQRSKSIPLAQGGWVVGAGHPVQKGMDANLGSLDRVYEPWPPPDLGGKAAAEEGGGDGAGEYGCWPGFVISHGNSESVSLSLSLHISCETKFHFPSECECE